MPADFAFKLFMVLSMLNLMVSWLFSLSMLSGNSSPEYSAWEVEAQRQSIHRRIWDPLYRLQRVEPMDGELSIYTHCFYGYALISILAGHPQLARSDVLAELEQLILVAEKEGRKRPFDSYTGLKPEGGVIPAGNTNLLRAGYVLLGGTKPGIVERFHIQSKELYDIFSAAPVPFLESAPAMIWPNDNCAALESLHLHDRLYGTSYSQACSRAENWLQAHLDPDNGMMNIQINRSGLRLDVPRGCGLSWSLAFMPGFAPNLDRQQYALYRQKWFVPVLGMYGIREWWPGQQDKSLIPSGPVVADIGWAASGLGIAAAHANCDLEGWLGLLRGLELLGFPNINIYGQKSYCGDLFLLGDVMALWSKTSCVWDQPDLEGRLWQTTSRSRNTQSGLFVWVLTSAGVISFLVLLVLTREAFASWKALRATFPISGWTVPCRAVFALQGLLALSVFLAPFFIWPLVVLCMLALKFLEKPFLSRLYLKRRQEL